MLAVWNPVQSKPLCTFMGTTYVVIHWDSDRKWQLAFVHHDNGMVTRVQAHPRMVYGQLCLIIHNCLQFVLSHPQFILRSHWESPHTSADTFYHCSSDTNACFEHVQNVSADLEQFVYRHFSKGDLGMNRRQLQTTNCVYIVLCCALTSVTIAWACTYFNGRSSL